MQVWNYHRYSEENTTVYLMDNLEVWKGLYELEHAGLKDMQAVSEMRKKLQAQIEKLFWMMRIKDGELLKQ